MTTADIRKRRVRKLIDEKFGGTDAHFALKIGKAATQVSRWFMSGAKHRRNIGESLAREIEENLGLPKYWLDQESDEPVPELEKLDPERRRRFNSLAEWLTPEQMDEIAANLDEVLAKMAGYKHVNEMAVSTFGMKRASTVSAARAASKLGLPPSSSQKKKVATKRRSNPTGDLF